MEPQRPIEATGLIKHISKLKKVPTGKLRVLDPMACRGLEVTFSLDDVKIPHDERRLLEAGVMLQFRIKGDSWNGFVAYQISPVDCAQYTGYVIRVPTPSNPRDGTVVSLDLTLDPVVIRKKSLEKLKLREPLACRDYVRVAIHWSDWISAQRANRKPEFDIVEVLERSKTRPRSLSQGREGSSVDQSSRVVRVREHLPSEELSPQYERSTRKQRRMSQGASRPRSRSVGPVVPSANDFVPLQSYPYMPAQRFPGQYPVFNPDVMYGSYNDFYNASLMWTASNYIPPYMQRGAP